jgi:hypothetical protein
MPVGLSLSRYSRSQISLETGGCLTLISIAFPAGKEWLGRRAFAPGALGRSLQRGGHVRHIGIGAMASQTPAIAGRSREPSVVMSGRLD